MRPPDRILLIRPSALGDVCRSVPVLASLRSAYPAARIDWLVQGSFVDAVRAHPALSGVLAFDRRGLGAAAARGRIAPALAFLRRIRGERYDLVLDCQGLFRSGLFAWASRAPVRAGYADARELGWLFLNRRLAAPASMHAVDRMLAAVGALGVPPIADMRLHAPPDQAAAIENDPRLAPGFVVIAPTSRWPGKLWPADRFARVARSLLDAGVPSVVIVGAGSERAQISPILELARVEPRIIDLVGGTSVGGLMRVIERSSLVLALDSAALHIAVGFDRPIVGLFGPTRVDLVGPYRRDRDVIQHVRAGEALDHKNDSLGRAIMKRISVDEVADACRARLTPAPRAPASPGSPPPR